MIKALRRVSQAIGTIGSDGVIVVLGCRVQPVGPEGGGLHGAAGRRARGAAEEWRRVGGIVIASGGRKWDGIVEADAFRDALVNLGVPAANVIRERCSYSTRENAIYTARILAKRGIVDVAIVTCDWHMTRAAALFRAEGMRVREVPVVDDGARRGVRALRWCRERLASWKDGVA